MKTKKYALILLSCLTLASCSLFDSLENKPYNEQTIELLATGSTWKVDSIRQWKFGQGIVTDSIFLNYGTIEFQKPGETIWGSNELEGYLIHSYTKNGNAMVDTLLWEPHGVGARDPDPKPLFDLSIQHEGIKTVTSDDDIKIAYNFRLMEKSNVNIYGEFKITQSGITAYEFHYSYRLTR